MTKTVYELSEEEMRNLKMYWCGFQGIDLSWNEIGCIDKIIGDALMIKIYENTLFSEEDLVAQSKGFITTKPSYKKTILEFQGNSIKEVSKKLSYTDMRFMSEDTTNSVYYSVDLSQYETKVIFNASEKEEITRFYIMSQLVEHLAEGMKNGTMKLIDYIIGESE